jgi:hypothetical protein
MAIRRTGVPQGLRFIRPRRRSALKRYAQLVSRGRGAYPACRAKSSNPPWFRTQQARSVWSIWLVWFVLFIWLIWFIWLVSFNQKTRQTEQTKQTRKTDWRTFSASC